MPQRTEEEDTVSDISETVPGDMGMVDAQDSASINSETESGRIETVNDDSESVPCDVASTDIDNPEKASSSRETGSDIMDTAFHEMEMESEVLLPGQGIANNDLFIFFFVKAMNSFSTEKIIQS